MSKETEYQTLDPEWAIAEIERLRQWVNDLQSGMYINCVYCGHRYGPRDEVPATMTDVLKEHIEQCPEHPCSELKAALIEAVKLIRFYHGEGIWPVYYHNAPEMQRIRKAAGLTGDDNGPEIECDCQGNERSQ